MNNLPRKPEKIYKDLILFIDTVRDSDGTVKPFAMWEVRQALGVSSSSITRVIRRLIHMGYVFKMKTGFANRYYKMTKKWTSANAVIEDYEMHRMVIGRDMV